MNQDWDMKARQRFNSAALFFGMPSRYTIVTPKSAHELRKILINNSNCDIQRKIPSVGSELKEQLNLEISKALSNKGSMKIHNYRHLLICESGCSIEMIYNLTWLATKQKFKKHDQNYKNSMKYCRMTAWENCNTGIKSRMLKHVLGYDQLSIGGCISVGARALGSDGVFDSALVSADSFGIVYSYHLELECAILLKQNVTKNICKKFIMQQLKIWNYIFVHI